MKKRNQPTQIDKEVILEPDKTIITIFDINGNVEFINDYFTDITGYYIWEFVGQNISIINHPQTPKVVYKLLLDKVLKGESTRSVTKSIAKNGCYFWTINDYRPIYSKNGEIVSIYSRSKAIPNKVKRYFLSYYKKLCELEKVGDVSASEAYLQGFLKDNKICYDEFILNTFNIPVKLLISYMNTKMSDYKIVKKSTFGISEIIKKSYKSKSILKKMFT